MSKKLRNSKILGGGIVSLLTFSFITCGFSTFFINEDFSANFNEVPFHVAQIEQLIQSDFSKGNQGCSCFSFCEEGFVENGAIVPYGTLTYYFTINGITSQNSGYFLNNTILMADLALIGPTQFSSSSRAIISQYSFQIMEGNPVIAPIGYQDIDKDGDNFYETIRFQFRIRDLTPVSSAISSELFFTFDQDFFDLENGFSKDNPPSFSLSLKVDFEE